MAREAGVSRTTVSYVLNATPHQKIPAATRERILDAVARLGYTPSPAARALSTGRSDMVLCLVPDWPLGPTVGLFLSSLSTALAREGLTLLAHPRPAGALVTSEIWRTAVPAAVVTWEVLADRDKSAIRAAGIPVIVALLSGPGRRKGELEVPQQRAGRMQVEHLAQNGHRRLAYAYPDDPRLAPFANARLAGVRAACAGLGLEEPLVSIVGLDPTAAAKAVATWREDSIPATAVCAYNDDVATAVLAGLHRLGLRAPDDMAVVGVDDTPTSAVTVPALTTVATDQEAMGDYVARVILAALAGRPAPRRPGAGVIRLVRRESA